MILADTSAWVEFDRGTGSAADRRMTELIASDGPLVAIYKGVQMDLPGAERALTQYIALGEDSERRNLSAVRMAR